MAHRTSSRLLFTAFGVSLLAGAGQLGLAFGFGIVRLTGAFTGATVNQWPAQLVWAGWFATNAAVIGAVFTERLARQSGRLTGTGRQLAVAGSAALGATVVAPLCMQPARSAELISVDPVWAVAICAVLGAVVGAGAALAVLVRPPLVWNMAAVAAVVWLLALLSVLPSLGASGPLTPVRLGVLEPAWLAADTAQQLALLILPMVTLLAGAATAAVARWRGHPPLVSGPSGVAGPVLVAFAYLAAGPGDTGDRYQLTPYYGALIAVLVGALGSAAAALLPWTTADRTTGGTAIEPTAILQPLPVTPALPAPARSSGDTQSAPASQVLVVDDRTDTSRVADGTRTDSASALDGDPPHWHWPVTHADTPADPTTPAATGPLRQDPAANTPPPAADIPPPAADTRPPADTRQTDAARIDAAQTDEPDRDDDRPVPADQTGSTAPPGDTDPAGAGKPTAESDGGPEQPSGPAPVGDGSDLPSAPRAVRPARKAPAAPAAPPTPAPAPTPSPAPAPAPAPPPAPVPAPAPPPIPAPAPVRASADAETNAAGDDEPAKVTSPEGAPRPRQRFPLPDLSRSTTGPEAPDEAALTAPEVSTETAATARDLSAAFTKPPAARAEDVQPGGDPGTGRRGLFRRGRPRSGDAGAPTERDEPLPAQDEEYVDWVAGLSRPLDDDEPEPTKKTRRTLRSTGRHHRD